MSATIIGARPPADVIDLPDGWYWWDQGVTSYRTEYLDGTTVPPGRHATGYAIPERWTIRRDSADLAARADAAIAAWRSDDPAAADLMADLPPGWRASAMRRIGYNTVSHADLIALSGWPVEREQYVTVAKGTPGAVLHTRPQVEVLAEELWPLHGRHRGGIPHAVDPSHRVARATAGAAIPNDWCAVPLVDRLARTAPLTLDSAAATKAWASYCTGPPSELVVAYIRPNNDGTWSAGVGTGGHSREVGRRSSRADAAALALTRLAADQQTAWQRATERAGDDLTWTNWPATPVTIFQDREPVPDLIGLADIAAILGITRGAVDQLRHRGTLPNPTLTVSNHPLWARQCIIDWAHETDRTDLPKGH